MKLEVQSAVNFLVHILRLAQCNIKETTLQKFKENLILEMYRSYRFHWYPENPVKGSGYRIIRINAYKVDPILVQAGKKVRIPLSILTNNMPHLILWINPFEVSYRMKERTYILYEYEEGQNDPWTPSNFSKNSKCCFIL